LLVVATTLWVKYRSTPFCQAPFSVVETTVAYDVAPTGKTGVQWATVNLTVSHVEWHPSEPPEEP